MFYEGLAYDDLVDWAGEGGVIRADRQTVAEWRIAEADKAVLVDVGVPNSDDVPLTRVCFTRSGRFVPIFSTSTSLTGP
ncbi:SUKH-4 family immunity protein [Streptomyces sp. V1I6]|uniref:SUKH-4 family immunity protein n=1 Tax=Streptomyces sp. V1I6 TaxID=3042273 RepID=UPI0027D7BC08|nr:SUKH-4 family immunity protein [Streptomyces sp. V1I6]